MLSGFRKFILRGNVVDLAIGIVIGSAFTAVVSSFVKDFVTPLIALIGGKPDFSYLYIQAGPTKFLYGDFLNNLISFLIVALVIYFLIVLPMNKIHDSLGGKQPPSPNTKECPYCLSKIPKDAKKCAFCTAALK